MSSWNSLAVLLVGVTAALTAGCGAKTPRTEAQAQSDQVPHTQLIEMSVTSDGFVPAAVKVKVGQPVRLVITRKTDRTCATDLVIKDFQIKQPLPLNQAVQVSFTPTHSGTIRYACAMDMISGAFTVQ